jgi:uncharacterized protein
MYTMPDQSWRQQPIRMSDEIVDHAIDRICEHALRHRLAHVRVILHGGEPLLAGRATLSRIAIRLQNHMPSTTSSAISLQTNGILLSQNLKLLDQLGIEVGVSLDGIATDNDHHRRFRTGHGSHSAVAPGLATLSGDRYRHLFRGLLCTINIQNDPISTYEHLLQFRPPAMDFLLPHRNWGNLPQENGSVTGEAPYADWLILIFDRWYDEPVQQTHIRLFEEIINLLLGGRSRIEGLGLEPLQTVVIETDGEIQQSDFLKSAYHGAGHTGLHIQDCTLDAALYSPWVVGRQIGALALSSTCRLCRLHRVCGGGQFAHRYRPGRGFDNPTVYCADLSRLIHHIAIRVRADIQRLRSDS